MLTILHKALCSSSYLKKTHLWPVLVWLNNTTPTSSNNNNIQSDCYRFSSMTSKTWEALLQECFCVSNDKVLAVSCLFLISVTTFQTRETRTCSSLITQKIYQSVFLARTRFVTVSFDVKISNCQHTCSADILFQTCVLLILMLADFVTKKIYLTLFQHFFLFLLLP